MSSDSNSHLRRPPESAVRRPWDEVEGNELRIDPADAAEEIELLNRELSGLYILFNQLRKHYWTLEGAETGQVEATLQANADTIADLTDDLAIRVHALGGVPVNGPMGVRQHATLRIEAGDVYDLRSALENDLNAYATLAVQFRESVERANELGDQRTVELLRSGLLELERDAHEIERYLADDSLA
jgi:DNA-binding ferritin-like protein